MTAVADGGGAPGLAFIALTMKPDTYDATRWDTPGDQAVAQRA